MKIAIQTNVWSSDLHNNHLERIIAEISQAGYQGLEIGAHRLNLDLPDNFTRLVTRNNLRVSGIHVHGELYDAPAVQKAIPAWTKAAIFATSVGSSHILISGKPKTDKTPADRVVEAETLNLFGKVCQQNQLTLCYHNHYWEIEHDYSDLHYLCAHTDPELVSLALDIGWVHRAGGKPAEAASIFLDRIRYFHFKDFRVKDFANDSWTELGAGYVDFKGVLQVIRGKDDYWITVERDEVLPNAFESARTSREYLLQLGI